MHNIPQVYTDTGYAEAYQLVGVIGAVATVAPAVILRTGRKLFCCGYCAARWMGAGVTARNRIAMSCPSVKCRPGDGHRAPRSRRG